jgi:hypothetical protein
VRDYIQSLNQIRLGLAWRYYIPVWDLDYLLIPDVKEKSGLSVSPLLVLFTLLLLFTWSPYFRRWSQPALALMVLIMGFGIIAMTIIAYPPGSYYYYAGLILLLMWTYSIAALRFLYATFAGWALVIAYEFVAIGLSHTPLTTLISNTFFSLLPTLSGCWLAT